MARKVCEQADSSEWNAKYAWNAGVRDSLQWYARHAGRLTHWNYMQGMRVSDSSEWNARNVIHNATRG